MDIYIPDIKLPKDEPGAFQVIVMYVGADGKLRAECNGTHEVTVVPPHGRLGDLDAAEALLQETLGVIPLPLYKILKSNTVIPASNEG